MRRSRLVVAGVLGLIIALVAVWKLRGSSADSSATDEAGSDEMSSTAAGTSAAGHDRRPQAPASLSGRVTRSADGAGVAGATVSITIAAIGPMFNDDKPPAIATTDASGAWTMPAVAPGTYEVAATALGLLPGNKRVVVAAAAMVSIDLALDAGGTLVTGTVTDATGGPIRGARVTASLESGKMFGGKASLVALTDNDGKYKLSLAPGQYGAFATHDDYTRSYKRFQLRGEALTVDFVLAPGGSVRGIVVTRDGKPVPGARVHAAASRMSIRDFMGGATTDDSGAFVLTSLGSGAIKLTATAKGYATESPTVVELGIGEQIDNVKVVVDRAFTISGRVVRAGKATEGIPGVMLGVFSLAAGGASMTVDPSDATGAFEIYGVKPGNYMMFAVGEGTVPEVGKNVDVVDKDVRDVLIEMTIGITLAGKVELNGPAAIAAMSLEPDEKKIGPLNMFGAMKALIVRADADPATGEFTMKNVPPGEFDLVAKTADGRKGKLAVVVATTDQAGLVVKLEARASIAGKVIDENGKTVPGVHVDVQNDDKQRGFSMGSRDSGGAMTGMDGGFEIVGLEPGKLNLGVGDDRGRIPFVGAQKDKQQFDLAKGQKLTGVTLTIEARDGVIKGVVVDSDQKPVPDAWVSVRQSFDPNTKRDFMMSFWRSADPILTGADGTFTADRLRRGNYDISVEGPKGATRASKDKVKTGETVTLVLETLGSITGRVTIGGTPVTEFDLGCRAEGRGMGRFNSDANSRRFTAADGTYTIDRLNPGEYGCNVTSNAGTATGKVTVATGSAKLDLALQPWATITGVAVDAITGKPLPNLIVLVASEGLEGKGFADLMSGKGPITDANGRFTVERVPIGKGQVHVAPKEASFNHLATRDYTATAGQRVDLGTIKLVLPSPNEGGTLGFFPGVDAGTLIVADVKPETPAERAGVQDKDKILTIDGHSVVDMGADVGKQLLMPGSLGVGQVVQLGLERAGKPVAVMLVAEKF